MEDRVKLFRGLLFFVALTSIVFAQARVVARPTFDAFEVASIKTSDPSDQGGSFITMRGAHQFVVKNYTLKKLIGAAYDLTPRAISGGPAWLDTTHYAID